MNRAISTRLSILALSRGDLVGFLTIIVDTSVLLMSVAVLDVQWFWISQSSFPYGAWFALVLPGPVSQKSASTIGIYSSGFSLLYPNKRWRLNQTIWLPYVHCRCAASQLG